MKRLLSVICAVLAAATVCGQQIKSREVGFDDFRTLLEAAGYEAFGFDLTELLPGEDRYDMAVTVKEYAEGEEIDSYKFSMGPNKRLLMDFPEESRKGITPDMMADPDAGVYTQAERLTIGFYPAGVDSIKMLRVDVPEGGRFGSRLRLRSVSSSDGGQTIVNYNTRPFRIDSFESGKFIPLVFFGSMWFDAKYNVFRFCGENEIAPDLSSEIVRDVPHFYVIGVEFTKKQKPENLKNN